MRARLKCLYAGPAGTFAEGAVVSDTQIPNLQGMVDDGYATVVAERVVEVASVAPAAEVAAIKQVAAPKHIGGGYYRLADGTRVRGKKAAGLA